jgi:hypothetical protein
LQQCQQKYASEKRSRLSYRCMLSRLALNNAQTGLNCASKKMRKSLDLPPPCLCVYAPLSPTSSWHWLLPFLGRPRPILLSALASAAAASKKGRGRGGKRLTREPALSLFLSLSLSPYARSPARSLARSLYLFSCFLPSAFMDRLLPACSLFRRRRRQTPVRPSLAQPLSLSFTTAMSRRSPAVGKPARSYCC